ncbi:MAG: hypothetical protein KGL39_10310 [Patescibacteria group bacterium]|nr:hypothetical protein [Patescibacteria group bacterium]
MKKRCLNPKVYKYPKYGGRGIVVCQRWMDFENFIADMGSKPTSKHTLERTNRNGNYEPSNCVWATQKVQQRNRSTNHILEFRGQKKTMVYWAETFGLKLKTLAARIARGWTVSEALTIPIQYENS